MKGLPTDAQTKSVRPRIGLVLSGGAARGLAHVGVISVLEEYGIPVDLIVSASFGSIVAGYYAYGYSIQQMLDFAKRFRLWSIRDHGFPRRSLFDGEKEEAFFREDLGSVRIEDLRIPVIILAADLRHRKELIFERGILITAMRASSAFPGLFEPFYTDEGMLIDGGVLNGIPVKVAREKGAQVVIFSDVSILRRIYNRKITNLLFQTLLRRASRRDSSPIKQGLFSIIHNTLSLIAEYQCYDDEAPDFLIEPVRGEIKPLRFKKVEEAYQLGRKAALRVIDDIVRRVHGSNKRG